MSATDLFRETLASIPRDVTKQVDWSFRIADKIDARLKELGMTQKEFAKRINKSEDWQYSNESGRSRYFFSDILEIANKIDSN